jgi:hypothetical protein
MQYELQKTEKSRSKPKKSVVAVSFAHFFDKLANHYRGPQQQFVLTVQASLPAGVEDCC